MARPEHPSYTELVYEVLRAADQPLTFQEILDAVERRRPITTRNPKATIRNALGQGKQLVGTGDGRYWYLPHCIRGSVLRMALTEKKPANQPIPLEYEVLQALWPSIIEAGKRRTERPMRVRLPTGDDVPLTLGHTAQARWATPVAEPLRRYLVDQRAAAGDSMLIRVIDAEQGLGEAWFESRLKRPAEAISARNRQVADAAYQYMREGSVDRRPIWEVTVALLAHRAYHGDVAPDPLRVVMRADPRFEFGGLRGWLGAVLAEDDVFVSLRHVPEPSSVTLPSGTLYQIKVTLRGTSPPVWRRLIVPADTRLSKLHQILQVAMGWTDSHLHQFEVGRRVIGVPSPDDWRPVEDERKVKLSEVATAARSRFRYQYDFGDSWEHDILVEKVLPPDPAVPAPACIGGRRACPPEDVGGVWGYGTFLEAIQDPSHPEHEERLEWIGDGFDPEAFDPAEVNAALRRLR